MNDVKTILAEQSRAEQSRAEQSRAEQSRAEQSRAEQSRAEQSGNFLRYENQTETDRSRDVLDEQILQRIQQLQSRKCRDRDNKMIFVGDLGVGGERGRVYAAWGVCPSQSATQYKDAIKVLINVDK